MLAGVPPFEAPSIQGLAKKHRTESSPSLARALESKGESAALDERDAASPREAPGRSFCVGARDGADARRRDGSPLEQQGVAATTPSPRCLLCNRSSTRFVRDRAERRSRASPCRQRPYRGQGRRKPSRADPFSRFQHARRAMRFLRTARATRSSTPSFVRSGWVLRPTTKADSWCVIGSTRDRARALRSRRRDPGGSAFAAWVEDVLRRAEAKSDLDAA